MSAFSRARGAAAVVAVLAASVGPVVAFAQNPPGTSCIGPNFGRMLNNLPRATWSLDALSKLADRVMRGEEEVGPEGKADPEENSAIAPFDAGLTYIGQFIDHDLDLDDRPNDLTTPVEPTSLVNRRTARFDLDSVYAKGPDGSPEMYEADKMRLKLGAKLTGTPDAGARDHLRDASGRALIGDGRNDENVLVAQVHTVFMRFHNLWVDRVRAANPRWTAAQIFAEARRQVTLHYHYAILTDFLPRVVGQQTMNDVLPPRSIPFWGPVLLFYDACREGMPVEFAVAAYRFGHSIVRPSYRINTTLVPRLPVFTPEPRDPLADLGGFRPIPTGFGIDWRFFFDLGGGRKVGFPQSAYKPDGALVRPLAFLPLPARGTETSILAKRNLQRGMQVGLPSGQDVARAMGFAVLRDDQILAGTATGHPDDAEPITNISTEFAGKAPLWSYILAEAAANAFAIEPGAGTTGTQRRAFTLGRVGGRIVAETFVGLLAADSTSLMANPFFLPARDLANAQGGFTFADLFRAVINKAGRAPGYYGGIGGLVWADDDGDGKFNEDEARLKGVTVTLTRPNGTTVGATTSESGEFFFGQLGAGTHKVCVTAGLPAGATATFDADGLATANCSTITLATDGVNLVQDFGYRTIRTIDARPAPLPRPIFDRGIE